MNGFNIVKIFTTLCGTLITLLPVILVFAVIFLFIYCLKKKVRLKLRTFNGKGFRPVRGDFGLFTYCGKQGLTERVKLTHLLSI